MDKASSSVKGGMRNLDIKQLDMYDHGDEARRVLQEIKLATEQVQESQFYAQLKDQIAGVEFQEQLKSVLGSQTKLNIIIYALGSLVYNFISHHQLALAILLQQEFLWINRIEVYDPSFVPADVIVLKELGCHVLEFNERGRRKVEEPTLFYMPFPEFYLVGNLLEANWCPFQINQLILLTNRMTSTSQFDEYTEAIHDYVNELVVKDYGKSPDGIIWDFAWHFFEIDSQVDMDTFLPGNFSKEQRRQQQDDIILRMESDRDVLAKMEEFAEQKFMRPFVKTATKDADAADAAAADDDDDWEWAKIFASNRAPRKYRCQSNAPPKDWIKLNISGIGAHGNTPGGFGGICHNESMKIILSYNGLVDSNKDESAACVEALKLGLTYLIEKTKYNNLIVEAVNLRVIQWVNQRHEIHKPSEEIEKSLDEVLNGLESFNYVAYHIYEEANLKAYELARKGVLSCYKKRDFL